MEEEIKKLQDQIKNLEAKGSQVPVVYLKSDRKFPKFGGRPVKDGDPDVYEWISDMREHIQSTKSKDEFVDFIMDHLTGSAKSEVKLRPLQERQTGKQILEILETVFEIKETTTQLLQKFYQRDQRQDETLEKYSLVLTEMAQKINRKEKKDQVNDIKLTERFIDGIGDQSTRQELRKVVLDSGNIPFFEFRMKMLRWIEDNPNVDASIKKTMCSPTQSTELDELKTLVKKQQEMLEWQQEQIDRLTKKSDERLNRQSYYQQERGRSRQRFGPRFNRGRNGRQGSFTSNRGRQCYNCGGLGHMSVNCPSENTPPTGSRCTSGNPNWKPSQ